MRIVGSITAKLICGGAGQATIFPFTFTVTPSARRITSVSPNSVAQGAQVTLNITRLAYQLGAGNHDASFYPAGVPVPSVDEITINSPTTAALAIAVPTTTPPATIRSTWPPAARSSAPRSASTPIRPH